MSSKTKPPDKGGTQPKKISTKPPENSPKPPADSKEPYKSTITLEIPRWLFFSTSVFVAFIAAMIGSYLAYIKMLPSGPSNELLLNVGTEGVQLFEQHDRNQDGYLSIEEFEPFIYRLLETNVTGLVYDDPIEDGDEIVTIRAYFEPLRMETMTKDFTEQFGGLDAFAGLKKWQTPSIEWMNFGARHFAVFLPPNPKTVTLGDVYYMVNSETSFFGTITGASLSANRYYPGKVQDSQVTLHRLLAMFHTRPFLISRFAPAGSVACVRAMNDKYFDIHFRIHAEFQLNEAPYHPYWFTPAQFMGNVIISRDGTHVLYFNLYVPNDKKLNVDMEWLNGPKEAESMEVDIGYMPLMKLNNTAPSKVGPKEDLLLKDTQIPDDPSLEQQAGQVEWSSVISEEDARRQLEVKMYPFKKVPYYNFTHVFTRAEEEQKLVHSILLWGALDDQSC